MEHTSKEPARAAIPALIFQMMRLMKQQFATEIDALPSYLHFETIRFINEQEAPSMRDVATFLKVAPPSATSLVNSLMDEGLIERLEDAADRRRVRLALSKKGKSVLSLVQRRRDEIFADLIRPLSETDCKDFERILTRITTIS